jgi:uncharacterized protein
MNKQRKIPLRKCVATGEMHPKKELLRIVRSKEGEVAIDPTGKKNGRGAYLLKDRNAVLVAKEKNVLKHSLQIDIDESFYNEIIAFIEKENSFKE